MIKNNVRKFRQLILRSIIGLSSKKMNVTEKKTLILSPHPDDETFGCGGLIIQKIQKGVDVYIVFLTNGEKSLKTAPKKEIGQIRKMNAIKAVKALGVNECKISWLNYPDGSVPRKGGNNFKNIKVELNEIVEKLEIEEIYAPCCFEGWSDHLAAYELAVDIVKESKQHMDLYLYWVWAWYYVGIKQMLSLPWPKMSLLAIKPVYTGKQQALNVYFDSKTEKGELYMGKLPRVFLNAFEWPYEVYEKKL